MSLRDQMLSQLDYADSMMNRIRSPQYTDARSFHLPIEKQLDYLTEVVDAQQGLLTMLTKTLAEVADQLLEK